VPTVKSLYASASRDRKSGEVIVKVVNVSSDKVLADVKLSGVAEVADPATALVLTSEKATEENSLEQPRKVAPVATNLRRSGSSFQHPFPPNSLTVLRLKTTP
jgi:alpha-L-arabinofuranosidase